MFVRQLDEVLTALLKQAAVRGIGNGFGHDGDVDNDVIDTSGLHHADAASRFNADHEQSLHPFFANTLAPTSEAGGIQRGFGLEVGFTGEVLDVVRAEQRCTPLIYVALQPETVYKFKHILDFLKEESLDFKPVH